MFAREVVIETSFLSAVAKSPVGAGGIKVRQPAVRPPGGVRQPGARSPSTKLALLNKMTQRLRQRRVRTRRYVITQSYQLSICSPRI